MGIFPQGASGETRFAGTPPPHLLHNHLSPRHLTSLSSEPPYCDRSVEESEMFRSLEISKRLIEISDEVRAVNRMILAGEFPGGLDEQVLKCQALIAELERLEPELRDRSKGPDDPHTHKQKIH